MSTVSATTSMSITFSSSQRLDELMIANVALTPALFGTHYTVPVLTEMDMNTEITVTGTEAWGQYLPIADYDPAFYDADSYYDKSEYSDEE